MRILYDMTNVSIDHSAERREYVHANLLLQELGLVCTCHCSVCLLFRRILDQCVTLKEADEYSARTETKKCDSP